MKKLFLFAFVLAALPLAALATQRCMVIEELTDVVG
jgi:hypothetical protein